MGWLIFLFVLAMVCLIAGTWLRDMDLLMAATILAALCVCTNVIVKEIHEHSCKEELASNEPVIQLYKKENDQ